MLCTILIMINEKKIVAFLLIKYLHINKYNQIGILVLSENLTFSVRGNPHPLHLNFHGSTEFPNQSELKTLE